jgi:hypothetical protein
MELIIVSNLNFRIEFSIPGMRMGVVGWASSPAARPMSSTSWALTSLTTPTPQGRARHLHARGLPQQWPLQLRRRAVWLRQCKNASLEFTKPSTYTSLNYHNILFLKIGNDLYTNLLLVHHLKYISTGSSIFLTIRSQQVNDSR